MADFSIQATQISPVQNAVTPQAGVVDQSGEIIGKAISGAIGPAVELYGTVKEQDFKREAEKEFRMNLGYTADPLGQQYEPKSPGEKELDQLADRASQMGVMGAGDNAALVLAARARAKIAKEPWFAERYKRASGQINEEYAQTIQLLNAAAANAAASMSADEKRLAARRKEVYDNAAGAGVSFPKPIDMMNDDELTEANQYALAKKSEVAAFDFYTKQKGEERAEKSAGRAEASAARNEDRFYATRLKEAYAQFNNSVIGGRETLVSDKMTTLFYSFVESGLLASNPAEAQKQFNAGKLTFLTQARSELNAPVVDPKTGQTVMLDKAEAQAAYQRLEAQAESYNQFIFGEGSNAAVSAAQAKALKDKYDLDVLKNPRLGRVLSLPMAIQQSVWSKLNLDAGIRTGLEEDARGLFTANDKAQAIADAADGKPIKDPALQPIATAAAVAAIDRTVAMQDPQVFNNFLSQVAGQITLINPTERGGVYKKVIRQEIADIVNTLPDRSGATENIRRVAVQQIEDLQRQAGPAISTIKYGKNGMFVSTDPRTASTVESMNGILKVLETVDPYGPISYGSRNELAKAFFNVNIGTAPTQIEAAQ
jgi:rRNA processing protein Gar1